MHSDDLHRKRILASVAATVISLACGTNYVYSAWAPQFAERLKLTATQSNLVGLFGNLGMYSLGPLVGMFVDHPAVGSGPAVLLGAVLLGVGYFPLHRAYDNAAGSVPVLCFFSYLTGMGSCLGFFAAVKVSALNWPHHRGTATAFPLAAFGLSAFFFSFLGSILFPGDPSSFLELLAWGTVALTLSGFFFLKAYPHMSYQAVPGAEPGAEPGASRSGQRLRRTSSGRNHQPRGLFDDEPGTSNNFTTTTAQVTADHSGPGLATARAADSTDTEDAAADETSSLMSGSSMANHEGNASVDRDPSHHVDIRGFQLLTSLEFGQLFAIMTILAGAGLMTIKTESLMEHSNIGNDANVLWKHYDSSKGEEFLVHRQQMHVSILSIGSFVGRLLSGIGSDFLVKKLGASRVWCLVTSGLIFTVAQVCGLTISTPSYLFLLSGLSGIAYGLLFGVFPSIVAETFGIHGLSQNWGFMTLAPVVSSNIFNLVYGSILDHHSVFYPSGERSCHEGLECYRTAYGITFASCLVGVAITIWVIRHQYVAKLKVIGKANLED
ncbi:MFS transporter, putative [Cordyceps militaris CM01]|uniref:MFS transporter, putative n=1 Tax=Cordyceps militaris (strain CM01) TaxID=983644 RepID=G3JCQ5_CORMM|nr:MFS transporter, putative [Cordyceps militaris CM01]EGX94663.1 MFS transporter, putative [Cordyceps militaris CM01]